MPDFLNNIIDVITPWLLAHGIKIAFLVLVAFAIHKIVGKALEKIIRRAVPPDDLSADAERKREDTLIRIFLMALKVNSVVYHNSDDSS